MLKAVRNAAASAAAWTLYHAPALERPYAYAAHAALTVPGVHTVFRETTDRLVARLAREHRADRCVEIGSVSPVFDVSSFTVKGRYFARVTYEPGATDAVLTTLGEGDVFVDIGANSGYFTVLAALRVGSRGRVFAFEPNPTVREQLQRHIELNAITDRVTVSELALADEDKDDVRLFVSCWPDNDGIASLMPSAETLARGGLRADMLDSHSRQDVRYLGPVGAAAAHRSDEDRRRRCGGESALGYVGDVRGPAPKTDHLRDAARERCGQILRDRGYRVSTLDEIPGGIPNLLFE